MIPAALVGTGLSSLRRRGRGRWTRFVPMNSPRERLRRRGANCFRGRLRPRKYYVHPAGMDWPSCWDYLRLPFWIWTVRPSRSVMRVPASQPGARSFAPANGNFRVDHLEGQTRATARKPEEVHMLPDGKAEIGAAREHEVIVTGRRDPRPRNPGRRRTTIGGSSSPSPGSRCRTTRHAQSLRR
jgi:hypothetical protein